MDQRPLRRRAGFLGILGAGLLFAAVSGCGSVVASDSASAPASAAVAAAAAPQVGCASVNQATAVSIRHLPHLMAPVNAKAPEPSTTYRKAAEVRALFGQMCAAVTHPAPNRLMHCPADIGTEWLGTFYDGPRALATFAYAASGCERVSVTAAGKTLSTMWYGRAAAAAPHLATDLAVIVAGSQDQVNPGGPNIPASS
ncbi:MAG: hypothetical protein ACRDOA_07785 [Streptosporangiaceae bacterium]